MTGIPHLSKSRYRNFLTCSRLGYLSCYPDRYATFSKPSLQSTTRMQVGTMVGEMARNYHPGGLLIEAGPRKMDLACRLSQEALASEAPILYEGTFAHDGILIRADILRRLDDGSWELTEAKSTGSFDNRKKKEYIPDVAVQLYVLENCGLRVSAAKLLHLDPAYVHPGGDSYDLQALFAPEDLTTEARLHIEQELKGSIDRFRLLLSYPDPPDALVKNSCLSDCEYCHLYCLPRAPKYRMTEMGHAWRLFDLFLAAGVDDLRDVGPQTCPEAYEKLCHLGRAPQYLRMIEAAKTGGLVVDKGLKEALGGIEFPIHFFDFEAWSPTLPVLAGTHPYETVPFQWSDHCLHADGEIDHDEFLAEGREDPRREVAESLIRRLGDRGSIVVYHQDYELRRLGDLAVLFPDLEDDLTAVASRVVDLEPMVTDHIAHPDFHGSYSLKKVYPVLVSGSGYADLAIQEGESAALAFERLRLLPDGADKDQLRADMLAYCRMDTQAMVDLYYELHRLSSGN